MTKEAFLALGFIGFRQHVQAIVAIHLKGGKPSIQPAFLREPILKPLPLVSNPSKGKRPTAKLELLYTSYEAEPPDPRAPGVGILQLEHGSVSLDSVRAVEILWVEEPLGNDYQKTI